MATIPGPDLSGNADFTLDDELDRHFRQSSGSVGRKLSAFPRFVNRSSIGRFIARYEIFKRVLSVQGSIIECGVHDGFGLFAFAQFSALLEPMNHRRRVIGFDTFTGFPSVSDADTGRQSPQVGDLAGASPDELEYAINNYDVGRPLSHIPKVHLVAGDFMDTGPAFVDANPHLIVSLLYLDFDLRDPTARALEIFIPRMPAGAIVAFDQTNSADWPGETIALAETIGLGRLRLERLPITSISWAVLTGNESGERL
ncbi:MAG: TylF/MycF/NovP-related O-methyltransferase [Acidimicrobiales bacterium]